MAMNLTADFVELFRGKIAHDATDQERVPHLIFLVDLATAEEMRVVAKECVEEISILANHPIASKFLKKVSFRLKELNMMTENAVFLESLAENVSNITDYRLCQELVQHIFMSMMLESTDPVLFLKRLFVKDVDLSFLSDKIIMLSNSAVGHKNLLKLVETAPAHVLCSLLSYMTIEKLLDVAFHCKGNYFLKAVIGLHNSASTCLVDCLKGSFFKLSINSYANYIVKECLESGTDSNSSSVISEICRGFDFLMTHCYGNYVVQKALRRLKKMDVELFDHLKQKILKRKIELESHVWGKQVLKALFYCEVYC